jgi:hypothetical protein
VHILQAGLVIRACLTGDALPHHPSFATGTSAVFAAVHQTLTHESSPKHKNLQQLLLPLANTYAYSKPIANMAKKGGAAGGGEGSKKAQGQARKADAAASKQAAKDKQAEAAESEEWNKGAKSNSKACVYTTDFESTEN